MKSFLFGIILTLIALLAGGYFLLKSGLREFQCRP